MMETGHSNRVVIVGASAAGLTAAETLRKDGFAGDIMLVGAEHATPYKRPPLSKQVLAGTWAEDRAQLRTRAELNALNADWRVGTSAVHLDRVRQQVHLADGSTIDYAGLVIATGVSPRHLAEGHELAGVHVLRTTQDAHALGSDFAPGRRLVVIGAGFLGCEVAAVASAAQLQVTLVDPLLTPMLRQLGAEVGGQVAKLHQSHGVELVLGVGVSTLKGENGRVTEVELTDGTLLEADVVLVAIGSNPSIEWLADSGLSLTNGVDCDEFCLAAPGIVAAGDVASWHHPGYGRRMRLEHQTNALEQGAAAARTLLGNATEPFAPIPFFWSDQYNVKIQVYGAPHQDATVSIVHGDPDEGRFAAVYRHGGQMVAVLTWNLPREAIRLRGELVSEMASRAPSTVSR